MKFLEKTTKKCSGFYTKEILNNHGFREGFKVFGILTKKEGTLAHKNTVSNARVGNYFVDLHSFESVILPELVTKAELVVIDEIGKMELFSSKFKEKLLECLDRKNVIATITKMGGGEFVQKIKNRPDVELIELTMQNIDHVLNELLRKIG